MCLLLPRPIMVFHSQQHPMHPPLPPQAHPGLQPGNSTSSHPLQHVAASQTTETPRSEGTVETALMWEDTQGVYQECTVIPCVVLHLVQMYHTQPSIPQVLHTCMLHMQTPPPQTGRTSGVSRSAYKHAAPAAPSYRLKGRSGVRASLVNASLCINVAISTARCKKRGSCVVL